MGKPGRAPSPVQRWTLVLIVGLGAAFLSAAGPSSANDSEASEKLILEGVHYPGDLPTLVAAEQDYFSKEGLSLEARQTRSGQDNLQRLLSGETDFALMALTPLLMHLFSHSGPAISQDDPVILANVSHSIGLNYIIASARSGIEEPGDLKERRIGVMRGTNAEVLLTFFLDYHHIDPNTIEWVDKPVDELAGSLDAGELDAAVLWEPWASRLTRGEPDDWHRFSVSRVYTAHWVLVSRRGQAEDNPDQVHALLRAFARAVEYIDAHPEEAQALYSQQSELDPEIIRSQWPGLIFGLSLNWSLLTAMQQEIEWAVDSGYANGSLKPGLLSYIVDGPMRALFPMLVSLPFSDSKGNGT